MKTDKQIPASKHFRLAQLAEGVFAAIHTPGGAALSNAGIVDLGERTLIFDTFMSPQAAVDLHNAAEALTGRPVDMAIDSHWHYDHIWGNQVFSAGTRIISTEETRRLIIATRGHGAYDAFMENAEANLETNRRQFEVAEDERQRRQLALWVDYYQALVALKPILRVRPPNLTFNRRLAFHGTARSAELVDYAGGHTESDLALFLSREGIAFLGDLLFIGYHPYLGGGDPDRLLQILEEISGRTPRLLVPGHGPVGKAESLLQMKKYVQTLEELAHKMVREGETEDMIEEMAIPGPYDDWLFASFFPGNMHYLYQRLLREQAGMRD
jgi:cyclase